MGWRKQRNLRSIANLAREQTKEKGYIGETRVMKQRVFHVFGPLILILYIYSK